MGTTRDKDEQLKKEQNELTDRKKQIRQKKQEPAFSEMREMPEPVKPKEPVAELERTYKDSVFVTVFQEKEKLIELYNALFDTNYDINTPVNIVTIKDVLFRTLKNDVAFTLGNHFVILIEHQSTLNGNMPLRHLLYIATLFKRMIDSALLYREKKVMLPRPVFIVLYNGKEEFPEYQEFRLSDSYLGEKKKDEEDALQAVVKVYNINNGKNAKILKKSETLRQYSRFVEIMREHKQTEELTNEVMAKIMNQCREEGVLVDFLQKYGTEIIEMLFKELTREEDLEISRLDGYDAGEKAGFAKGEQAGYIKGEQVGAERGATHEKRKIAKEMKRENIAQDVIAKVTGLNVEEIESL